MGQGRVRMGQCVGQPWPESREGRGPGKGPREKGAWKGDGEEELPVRGLGRGGRDWIRLLERGADNRVEGPPAGRGGELGDPAPKGEGRAGA